MSPVKNVPSAREGHMSQTTLMLARKSESQSKGWGERKKGQRPFGSSRMTEASTSLLPLTCRHSFPKVMHFLINRKAGSLWKDTLAARARVDAPFGFTSACWASPWGVRILGLWWRPPLFTGKTLSAWSAGGSGWRTQGLSHPSHPWLHSELEASLDCIRLCLEITRRKQKAKQNTTI